MAIAPWRSPIARALHRNRAQPFCRFLQLATVRPDGTPANRTVVFRGFLDNSNQLMFISDRRSEKTTQIQQNPNAEVCWYFTKTREQFRLSGHMTVITADTPASVFTTARQQLWQRISDSARLQFAWPTPKDSRPDNANFTPPAPDEQSPIDSFCLLLLNPHHVDHLNLRGDPQDRTLYKQIDAAQEPAAIQSPASSWISHSVNP